MFKRKRKDEAAERTEPAAADDLIDLTEPEVAPEPAGPTMGAPGTCTECGSRGYLDSIDIRNSVQYQHCPSCGHAWEFDFSDVDESVG